MSRPRTRPARLPPDSPWRVAGGGMRWRPAGPCWSPPAGGSRAQAPGIAQVLRQLPRNVIAREEWPALLLGEFARLHLLTAAHRRLDELEPALAAAVRTHIGYPT